MKYDSGNAIRYEAVQAKFGGNLRRYPIAVGVGVDWKQRGGQSTGGLCLVVMVLH